MDWLEELRSGDVRRSVLLAAVLIHRAIYAAHGERNPGIPRDPTRRNKRRIIALQKERYRLWLNCCKAEDAADNS
jgi:hypothetical protein